MMSCGVLFAANETREVELTVGNHEAVFTGPSAAAGTVTRRVEMTVKDESRAVAEIPGIGWAHENNSQDNSIDINKCDNGPNGTENTENDELTIGYFGPPQGDNGYNFVTTIIGSITTCGGSGGTGGSSSNDFTLLITDEDTVHIDPDPAYTPIGSWVKLESFQWKSAQSGNSKNPIPVVWSSSSNIIFAETNGGSALTQTQLEGTEREFIWVKSDQGGMYEITVTSSEDGAEGTTSDFLVANFYVDTSPLNFLRETTYDLQVTSDPSWAVDLVEIEVDPVSESYWWVEWKKSTNKISFENLIEEPAIENEIDEAQAEFFLKLGGRFEWTFQKVPFLKNIKFKKHLLGIYPLIKEAVVDYMNDWANTPGDFVAQKTREEFESMTALDSSGMIRGMAQSRINEMTEISRSETNRWVYEDVAHILLWADVNEPTLEGQIVKESWRIHLSGPTPTINLSDVTISTDVGSTAGDYIKAVNETGLSGKAFGYESLDVSTTLTANGESAVLDFQVGGSLIFTFNSEWYNDENSHLQRGGITTKFYIFIRIKN